MPENRKTKYMPNEKKCFSFFASFSSAKTFQLPKTFGKINDNIGQPHEHSKSPLGHWKTKERVSKFKNAFGRLPKFKLFVQKKLCRSKNFAEFFRQLLCFRPVFMCTKNSNRYPSWLGDIDIYRKTFLKMSQICAEKIKNKTRNHRYRNNRQLSRYRRFARSAAGLKNF